MSKDPESLERWVSKRARNVEPKPGPNRVVRRRGSEMRRTTIEFIGAEEVALYKAIQRIKIETETPFGMLIIDALRRLEAAYEAGEYDPETEER